MLVFLLKLLKFYRHLKCIYVFQQEHFLESLQFIQIAQGRAVGYLSKPVGYNNNKDIDSISELGRIFSNENNFEDALKYFEMAIAIDKNHKKTNLRIGNMFMKINEHKKGLSYIQKATGFIRFTDNGAEIV